MDPQERDRRNTVDGMQEEAAYSTTVVQKSGQHCRVKTMKDWDFRIKSPHPHEILVQKNAAGESALLFCTKSVRVQGGKCCCLLLQITKNGEIGVPYEISGILFSTGATCSQHLNMHCSMFAQFELDTWCLLR